MNYDLCKKLKEAGYEQQGYFWLEAEGNLWIYDKSLKERDVVMPTLSELIEACGDGFSTLEVYREEGNPQWCAFEFHQSPRNTEGTGSTPEEAVANLWLDLKGNK